MSNEVISSDTEVLIKAAAKSVFLKKGLAGARLQEIADEAGIGRTCLHYYFRSKEKLFEVVFSEAFEEMHQRMGAFNCCSLPVREMMKMFVTNIFDKALLEPEVDIFLINEFNQNPEAIGKVFKSNKTESIIQGFIKVIEKAVANGELKGDPYQIMITLISLCSHPFAAKAMMQHILELNEVQYTKLLMERKKFVINLIDQLF